MKQKDNSFLQKLALVIFGVFMSLVMLEIGLRIAGHIAITPKEMHNERVRKREGDFTILCLGESTTDGQWPPILQEILDDAALGVDVRVIDEGKRCMDTGVIVHNLQAHLDRYDPDMVITMMGINDWEDTVEIDDSLWNDVELFLKDFRVYKLAKLLWMHLVYKWTGENVVYADDANTGAVAQSDKELFQYNDVLQKAYALMTQDELEKALAILNPLIAENPTNVEGYIRRAWVYERQGRSEAAANDLKQAYQLQKDDIRTILEYATFLKRIGKQAEVEPLLLEAYELDENDPWILREIGELAFRRRDYPEAERLFKKAMIYQPENPDLHMFLGRICTKTARHREALAYLKQGVSLKPEYVDFMIELVQCYFLLEEYDEAVQWLTRAQELDPDNVRIALAWSRYFQVKGMYDDEVEVLEAAYEKYPAHIDIILALIHVHMYLNNTLRAQTIIEEVLQQPALLESPIRKDLYFSLSKVYIILEKYDKADALFERALNEFPEDARLLASRALFYLNRGESEKANLYFEKVTQIKSSKFNAATMHNYNRLNAILDERGVQLVAVQYPMRNVSHLKQLLGNDTNIIFVDNEKVFKDAVFRDGYDAYFWDNFAGDFGHCTDKGNRLLAENIARTIIQEYFGE